jgi:uncharacterized metal-binding protein YceD (DUF177 family)
MRLVVEEIREERSVSVPFDLDEPWARKAVAHGMDASPSSLSGHLDVSRSGVNVRVAGSISASATVQCARCTVPVTITIDAPVDLAYVPVTAPEGGHPEEKQLDEDELDLGFYTDGALDLADVLSEAVALELPIQVVCEDTSACEARTSALLAAAAPDVGHPAFQALRSFSR